VFFFFFFIFQSVLFSGHDSSTVKSHNSIL